MSTELAVIPAPVSTAARYAHVIGWGMHVPEKIVTNDDLSKIVDTNDEWIQARTGIRQRHVAADHESTVTFAVAAARKALAKANISPAEVDLIIVGTASPEHIFPSTACLVQDALGATNAGAYDLLAACTSFIYALSQASNAIKANEVDTVLVIGAEALSKITDWSDRGTCILFGDGAGAFVMQARSEPGGFVNSILRSDGSGGPSLVVPAGGTGMPASTKTVMDNQHYIKMNGREVFRFATRVMASACQEAAQRAGITIEDIDIFVPHQANKRIIESATKKLKVAPEKMVVTIQDYGNTSSASIPIAICEAIDKGQIKQNDTLMLVAFGGGLTWGAGVLKWDVPPPAPPTRVQTARRSLFYRYARVKSFFRRMIRFVESRVFGDGVN